MNPTSQPCPAGQPRRCVQQETPPWQHTLPAEWLPMVVVPDHFKTWRDAELDASRTFGYDPCDEPCYYAHRYVMTVLRCDDDDEFYEAPAYGEQVEAWLLRDERWLIHRIIRTGPDCTTGRGFFSFSDRCPR